MLRQMGAILASTVSLVAGTLLLSNNALAGGDFSQSCIDIRITNNSPILKARCKDEVGNWNDSELDLNRYIANMNGSLTWLENGIFFDTCSGLTLNIAYFDTSRQPPLPVYGTRLSAHCKKGADWIPVLSEINLNERISNSNGNLTYVP